MWKTFKALAFSDGNPPPLSKAKAPDASVYDTLEGLDHRLQALRRSLRDAESQLERERAQRSQHDRQVRQDMLLDMLIEKEASKRAADKLEGHLRAKVKLIEEKVCVALLSMLSRLTGFLAGRSSARGKSAIRVNWRDP